jgi:hypothetical protein
MDWAVIPGCATRREIFVAVVVANVAFPRFVGEEVSAVLTSMCTVVGTARIRVAFALRA